MIKIYIFNNPILYLYQNIIYIMNRLVMPLKSHIIFIIISFNYNF